MNSSAFEKIIFEFRVISDGDKSDKNITNLWQIDMYFPASASSQSSHSSGSSACREPRRTAEDTLRHGHSPGKKGISENTRKIKSPLQNFFFKFRNLKFWKKKNLEIFFTKKNLFKFFKNDKKKIFFGFQNFLNFLEIRKKNFFFPILVLTPFFLQIF